MAKEQLSILSVGSRSGLWKGPHFLGRAWTRFRAISAKTLQIGFHLPFLSPQALLARAADNALHSGIADWKVERVMPLESPLLTLDRQTNKFARRIFRYALILAIEKIVSYL